MNEWMIDDTMPDAAIGMRAIVTTSGDTVCRPSPMGEHNARLIAAAPDLYAAACAFLDVVGDATAADLDRLTLQFAAAVSKARGEQ
jgi:hypothetical protein